MVSAYDKYILAHPTEPTEFKKVVLFSTMKMAEKQSVKANIGRIFDFCDNPDDYINNHLFHTMPVLFWDRQTLIEKYGISGASSEITVGNVYNAPEGIIVSKLDTTKLLIKAKFPYLPKTYFTREEAEKNLKFPIIAKASNTFQSRGVEKLSTRKSLAALDKGFDLYQEQIKIDEEFRVVFFRGKNVTQGIVMLAAYRRDPLNDKAKDLRTNEADGSGMKFSNLKSRPKSNFSWTQVSPYAYSKINIDDCYKIADTIFALNPTLNVAGLDIAVDKAGKHWFIESNSTPGLFSNMIPLIYKFIYEDHYGAIQEYGQRRLRDMCYYFTDLTSQDEPTFEIDNHNLLSHVDGYLSNKLSF